MQYVGSGIKPMPLQWKHQVLTTEPPERSKVKVLVAQSCLTLRDPMDFSLPSSSICGIFQARILE